MDSTMITDTSWEDLEQQATDTVIRITTLDDDDPNKPFFQKDLGQLRYVQFRLSGDPEYLDEAVSWAREAIQSVPADTPLPGGSSITLVTLLSAKYQHTKTEELQQSLLLNQELHLQVSEELSDQIEQLSMVLTAIPDDDENLPAFQNLLAQMYFDHSLRAGDGQSFDSAAMFAKKALKSTIRSDNNRESFENLYRRILMHQKIDQGMSISDAMELSHKQARTVARDIPNSILSLFDNLKSLDHFKEKLKTVDSMGRGMTLSNEYVSSRDSAVIDRAINTFENSIIHDDLSDDTRRAWRLHGLSKCFAQRYEFEGLEEDLHKALEFAEKAKKLVPADDLERKNILQGLGDLQRSLFHRNSRTEYLDKAIENHREAVRLAQNDDSDRPEFALSLGMALNDQSELLNNLEHREAAGEMIQQAITLASGDSVKKGCIMSEYADILEDRYNETSNLDYLELAIKKAIEAKNLLPECHHAFPRVCFTIGNLHHVKFKRLERVEDLGEAITFTQRAVEMTPENRLDRGKMVVGLAQLLGKLYDLTGNIEELETGIRLIRETISSLPAEHISIPDMKRSLGALFMSRMGGFVGLAKLVTGLDIDLSTLTSKLDDLDELINCQEQTLKARELSREDQQYAIKTNHGFAAEICTLSIQLGNIEEALQRVEYGRGLILGHLIDRKDDLAVLQEKHPDFARRYQELRHKAFRQIDAEKLSESWESMMEDRRKAHAMMQECEKEIRRNPGFENFQQPPPLEELQKSAADGPIIVINISSSSADAIILTTSHLEALSLPGMTGDVPEIFQRVLGRYRSGVNTSLDPGRNVEKDVVLVRLQELGALPETSGDPPRVWWIGSGAASSLPFHAAGDFDEICRLKSSPEQDLGGLRLTCMDWVTPSYAPTIKALQYARTRADKLNLAEKPSILVVAMPETPGQSNLTGVVEEKFAVQESAIGFCVESPLEYPSTDQVLERLQGSSVAHFACHGMSDSANPDASHILLQRRDSSGKIVPDQLTVGAILDATTQSESGSWLVYLSACSTAQVKAKNMGDENIHLATEDSICVEVARRFYEELSKYSGEERKFAVAYALRKAVMSVRSQHYHDPALWAPFIHFGA
ncbi:uncharacterized protein LTHEOB_780 [Lasiodiplodia theobromae]|uniref:uncharacterized protein n=1 Tax=Lasiodiplodia theobromae TaxID=45133 RepID=UPI0015C3EB66|nr:uncharacterized protein LTHEOB_780 [Lasiodiplodia theobromae]KAF4540838.1 hypothetical protein LTHEOB_780 [Lasiodiplodia theobromae]